MFFFSLKLDAVICISLCCLLGVGGSHSIHLISLEPLSETKYAHMGGKKEM